MMNSALLLRGLVIGFSIAAPVGPIGVLCIRRTLANGRAHGLASGLGAATADAVYGMIAGFGLTAISGFLVDQALWLRLVGGLFLLWLGIRTLRAQPSERPAQTTADQSRGENLLRAYSSTLALTLTNPATILAFAAIFAGAGLADSAAGTGAALVLVAGVFAGSAAWWLLLSSGVGVLRARVTTIHLRWINWLSGIVLIGFGLTALAAALL